jgi:hypothetical protein
MSDPANGHPRDLLSEYLDDELGFEERASVDRHLAGCEDCRAELDTLRRLARALADENVPPVPVDLEARIGRRLDAGTLARPARWRFAVPASIAATLGAVGLLVALLWREGRIGVPPPPAPSPAPESKQRALDEVKPSFAPTPKAPEEQAAAAPREKADTRVDAFKKDLPVMPEVTPYRDAESIPAASPAAVPDGVAGGVEGGVEGGVATRAKDKVAAQLMVSDARHEPAAAKTEVSSVCTERWSDSGIRARWAVQDVAAAVGDLDRMARDVGGVRVWRGIAEGGPYVLVVPRPRFEEVFFALRARGMEGLAEPPTLDAGSDCAGISIEIAPSR